MSDNSWNDKDLESLYKTTSKERSPSEMDALILSVAKKSCETAKGIDSKTTKNKWLFALPTAAVVVLGVAMMLKVYQTPHVLSESNVEPATEKIIEYSDVEFADDTLMQEEEPVNKLKRSAPAPAKPILSEEINSPQKAEAKKERISRSQVIGQLKKDQSLEKEFDLDLASGASMTELEMQPLSASVDLETQRTEVSLEDLIESFNQKIDNKDYKQAQALLDQIKVNHPFFDTSLLQEKLNHSECK